MGGFHWHKNVTLKNIHVHYVYYQQHAHLHPACVCLHKKQRSIPVFLTCAFLTDDHTQIDRRPLRLRRAAVGAASIGLFKPDLLCHFIVVECLGNRFFHRFNPLLLLAFWLGREAATIDFFILFFAPTQHIPHCYWFDLREQLNSTVSLGRGYGGVQYLE